MNNDFNGTLTLAAAGTVYSTAFLVSESARSLNTVLDIQAIAGTDKTLDVTLQFSEDKTNWTDEKAYPQKNAVAVSRLNVRARALYFRFKVVLGGTGASFTARLSAQESENFSAENEFDVYNVPMASANTEYSQALPTAAKKVLIRLREADDLKLAFVSGASGTTYITIPAGSTGLWLDAEALLSATWYFQCSTAGATVEILVIK